MAISRSLNSICLAEHYWVFSQISSIARGLSGRQDAALYGRPEARRYGGITARSWRFDMRHYCVKPCA
jgi:hypothetical protein